MKRCGKTVLCLLSILALTNPLRAAVVESATVPDAQSDASGDQPYSSIWVRNVFDLKPNAPPPAPPQTNPPPANVKLLGITTIFGNKRAILSIQEPPTAGQPPKKDDAYSMTVGERRGPLEVLEINPDTRSVKIKNDEIVSTISFETNKAGIGAAAAPAPLGGGAVRPGFGFRPGPGGGPSTFLPPRMTPQTGGPQGFNPGGYPAGYSPAGVQPAPSPEATAAAALAAFQQIQANRAAQAAQFTGSGLRPPPPVSSDAAPAEATDSGQSSSTQTTTRKIPPGFGPRTTGTLSVPTPP